MIFIKCAAAAFMLFACCGGFFIFCGYIYRKKAGPASPIPLFYSSMRG